MKTRYLVVLVTCAIGWLASACSAPLITSLPAQPSAAAPTVENTSVAQVVPDTAVPPTVAEATIPPTDVPPPTATLVPPTDTATIAPPTATETIVLPTATTIPPTATETSAPPTATETSLPPTATAVPPAATTAPTTVPPTRAPTKPPVAANPFSVTWKTNVEYNNKDASSNWCQLHNETMNLTSEDMLFQDPATFFKAPAGPLGDLKPDGYQPVFGIANADGTLNRWSSAGWYAKMFGWRNGIEDFPPKPVIGGTSSGDWTWYSVVQLNGEYCRFVYVRWKGQVLAAEYAPDGKLINVNATLPPGAP